MGLPEDIEQMAEFLGPDDPAIRRLLKTFRRDPEMAETVRACLKRRCIRAGFDPDDPAEFWPVRELPDGLITLGRVCQRPRLGPAFALPGPMLTQHVGIFGHSGTGKSFLAMHMVKAAVAAGLGVWVFDIEDEYARLIPALPDGLLEAVEPSDLRLNFFQPPGPWVSPQSWLGEIDLLLRGAVFLRDGTMNLFQEGLLRLLQDSGAAAGGRDWPSLCQVKQHFAGKRFGAKSRSASFLESLLNRLPGLMEAFRPSVNVTHSDVLANLARRSVIFRLHGLTGIPLEFLTGYLLLWLARYREGVEGPPHLVVIEEAHMLSRDKDRQDIGEDILIRTFRTARKRGIGLVLCDQVPSGLPEAIQGNLGCRVVMRLVNATCLWRIQASMGLRRNQTDAIGRLRPREAVAQYSLHPNPFLIEVPPLSFPQRPDEARLRAGAEAALAQAHWREESVAPAGAVSASLSSGELAGDALLVMVRICEHPAESIDQRCQALRMDRSREFRGRAELDTRGWIAEEEQTIAGKIKFFRPTDKGLTWANDHGVRVKKFKSGIVHEYLLSELEKGIGALGPKWRTQRNTSIARERGLQPDLLVLAPDGRRIIVEVCCSNVAYDAENMVAEAGIPEVDGLLAVTPDKPTKASLEEALADAMNSAAAETACPIRLLDAGACLAEGFDWAAGLAGADGE